MVHALKEIWRVLTPQGCLVDLRPLHSNPLLEIVSQGDVAVAGQIDETEGIPNDTAANKALAQVVQEKWFTQEQVAAFNFASYWDTPDELKAYAAERWRNSHIPAEALTKARGLMAERGEAAKVRVLFKMLIARYRKGLADAE